MKVLIGFSCSLALGLACLWLLAGPASAGLVRTGGWESENTVRPFNLSSVTVDDDGNAYVADYGLTRIVRIDASGDADLNWGTGTPGLSYPPNPVDLTTDDDGNVYALDMDGKKVRKYSSSGNLLTSWPVSSAYYGGRWSIAWESGKVWVLTENKVSEFEPDGTPVALGQDAFDFDSIPNYVTPQIAGDGNGHLVIASAAWVTEGTSATRSIYRFDTDGSLLSKWTSPATVTHVSLPAGGSYYTVDAYYSLAVDPSGDIWVSTAGSDHPFRVVDASGLQPGGVGDLTWGGDLTIDNDNGFWTIRYNPDHLAESQVRRSEIDGSGLQIWGAGDFPDYADQVWPASFKWINDYSVDSSGNVAILDLGFHRVKIFNADGDFLRGFKVPEGVGSDPDYVARVNLKDDGTVEVFDGKDGKLRRYDSSGALTGESVLDVPGRVKQFAPTADGGHLIVSRSGSVTNFDANDLETGSWSLQPHGSDIDNVKGIVQAPAGDVYVLTPDFLDHYSAGGELLGTWSLRDEECAEEWSDGFVDLDVDAAGNVYATASLGAWINWTKLYAFDPELNLIWSDNMDQGWGATVKVAPDGSFLTAGDGINRIGHVGPDDPGLVTTCRRKPGTFKLLGVKFGPKRTWARLRVSVPEAGRLSVKGRKVIARTKSGKAAGTYRIAVLAKPRYLKPSRRPRIVKVPVRISFSGASTEVSKRITIRLKSRKRQATRSSREGT